MPWCLWPGWRTIRRIPSGLGGIVELAPSIRAQGLLEPLIVLTAAPYARVGGQEGYPDPGFTHVIVMGHRRAVLATWQ